MSALALSLVVTAGLAAIPNAAPSQTASSMLPLPATAVAPLNPLPAPDDKTGGVQSQYAGGAGDALQLCCMATWCTTAVIDDCDLLSPLGKAFAGGTAVLGGVMGFAAGYTAAVVLTTGGYSVIALPVGEIITPDAEGYVTLGALSGAAGVFVGGAIGLVAAIMVEPWVQFFFAAPTPRTPSPQYPRGPDAPPRP